VKLLRFIFLLHISSSALAQIQGHVVDADKGTPLPFANVYIANTTKGSRTDETGAFHIRNLSQGHYRLIVSYMGYSTQVIEINTADNLSYKILLKPASKELPEAIIRARTLTRSERANYFKLFKEHFIGLSDNHRLCSIKNPHVLDFFNKDAVLTVVSDSVIIMENLGLGYRIRLFLEKYEYNFMRYRTYYEHQIVFEPLEPKDDDEKKQWAKARLKAYYGSEMEFFRSVYRRQLFDDGYAFNVIVEKNFGNAGGIKRVGIADTTRTPLAALYNYRRYKISTLTNYNKILDSLTSTPETPVLKFTGELRVDYIHEGESHDYQLTRHRGYSKTPQISQVKLLRDSAVIQANGQIYPPDAIETSGYWSWELMSEALPLDYEPDDDIKLTGFRILTQSELEGRGHK
jgi:hypothetical protein